MEVQNQKVVGIHGFLQYYGWIEETSIFQCVPYVKGSFGALLPNNY